MQGVGGGSGEGAGIIPRMNEELFARCVKQQDVEGSGGGEYALFMRTQVSRWCT